MQEVKLSLSTSENAELARALDTLAREALDEIRERLPQSANEKALDLAGVVHDMGDESVARMHDDLRHLLLEHRLSDLRKIEAARARLAAGEIDRCIDCGSEIGYERLRVNPIATRCVDCQARYEMEHRDQSMLKL
jgi:DnaK suppressor protein